jgi:hypothetical protein
MLPGAEEGQSPHPVNSTFASACQDLLMASFTHAFSVAQPGVVQQTGMSEFGQIEGANT